MSVPVRTNPDFRAGTPKGLLSGDAAGVWFQWWNQAFCYTVTRDGKNIIALRYVPGGDPPKTVLVENWLQEFKNK